MKQYFFNLWNKSFQAQLIYGISAMLVFLIVTFTYVSTKNHSDFLHEEGLKQASSLSLAVATASKVWVMTHDYVGLEEVLNRFSMYDDLVFATVIDRDGKIIAHTDASLVGKYIADESRVAYFKRSLLLTGQHSEEEEVLLQNESYIDMIRMIHNGDQHIGFVNVRLDQSSHQKNIKATILQGILFTLASIIIGIIFAYLVAHRSVRQLLRLTTAMKKVSDGDKSIRADESGVKELSELSHEFNSMLKALNKSETLRQKFQERLELAFTGSDVGLWDWNIKEDSIYFSVLWKAMLGYSDSELPHKFSSWEDRIHPDDKENVFQNMQNHLDNKTEFYKVIYRLKHKDGYWIWVLSRGKALFDEEGTAIRMVGTHIDITNSKEMQLTYAHQVQIIEQTHDAVISTDLEGHIVSWNAGAKLLFGYAADEVVGKPIAVLYRKQDFSIFQDFIETVKKTGIFSADVMLVQKSKETASVLLSLTVLKDEEEKPTNIVWFAQNITKRKAAEEALFVQKDILDHQAHYDVLTKLPNRLLFGDRLAQAIVKAKYHKKKFALLFVDLDQFKQINDSFGHDLGDKVLQIVSDRLESVIRNEDTLARMGSDEFTIIAKNRDKVEDIAQLSQKILGILNQAMNIDGRTLYISCSIGISFYPEDSTDTQSLLKYADAAMYKAKDEGRNNFQFYSSEMTARALEHVTLETGLRQALEKEEFIVYYQPQINAENDTLIGMEALVRWQHPTRGLISPLHFIPTAEKIGLIVPLDQWVMKTAMKQLAQWYKEGLSPGILALNLSIKQLQQKDFISILNKMLIETDCKTEWLELEVTESQIMTNPEDAIVALSKISAIGIRLAIDDFGTGYSSLSYLKRLPIDKLKIDQSFVKDLPENEEDAGITKIIIALSKSLNLTVIAEGVETKEQKDFLLENGCNNIQGYFYAKPMPADEMEARLREIKSKL